MKDYSWFAVLLFFLCACGSEATSPAPDASGGVDGSSVDSGSSADAAPGEPDAGLVPEDGGPQGEVQGPVTFDLPDLGGDPDQLVVSMPGLVGVQPAVAVGPDGVPLVVFAGTAGAEGDLHIYAAMAGQESAPLKVEPPGQRNEPAVCALSAGGFVAVWSYDGQAHGNPLGIEGAILDGDGAVVSAFAVTTEVEGNHWLGHVACHPSGGFTVVGSRTDTDDTTFGVFAQGYEADGSPVGDPFGLNPEPAGTQVQPVVGVGPDGSGVVVYEDAPEDDAYQLTGRVFDASGPVGAPFTVLAQGGVDCLRPAVAISPGGVVAYAGNWGTQVVVSTASSLNEPGPSLILLETTGSHGLPDVAFLDREDVLVAAFIENLTGAGAPSVRLDLLGSGVDADVTSVLLGDDPQLPPYPPAVAYGAGTLAVAWTQRTTDGFEIHLGQFKSAVSEP